MQFIWVQLFLWSSLVGPAPSEVSAELVALIDGALAAEEGAAATSPPPGPCLEAVGALKTVPRGCTVLQRDPAKCRSIHPRPCKLGQAKLYLFLPELKPASPTALRG